MQTRKWLAPLLLGAACSAQAWEQNTGYGGPQYAYSGTNNSFGFSMGFNGATSGRYAPVILQGVNFKYDSAELTPESGSVLDEVASILRASPGQAVEVSGHASSEGNVAYNMDLSLRRASAVRDYLIEQGVTARNMRITGYGELQPVSGNEVEQGRSRNRRVELRRL